MSTPLILVGVVMADLESALETVGAVAGLAAAIGLGVAVFVWARNWRQQVAEDATTDAQIDSYRQLLEDGIIDDQEFERIQARVQQGPVLPRPNRSRSLPTDIRDAHPQRSTDKPPEPPAVEPPPEQLP